MTRFASRVGPRAVAILLLAVGTSNCPSLFEEGTESFVTVDFLVGNWRIWSMRLADGLTLSPGENGFAGHPETVWTLRGNARFNADRADIQYSIIVAVAANPPDTTSFVFAGTYEVDRTVMWVTQDVSGEVVRMTVRRNDAAIMVGQQMLENLFLSDRDGNESLWVRQ